MGILGLIIIWLLSLFLIPKKLGDPLELGRGIYINHIVSYFIIIIILSLGIRIILSAFKCAAIRQGEADEDGYNFKILSRWQAFWVSYFSWGHHRNLDDYWLPTLIGSIELFVYPVLMFEDKWLIIGAWLTIKTAVQWHKWSVSRTPYNRFLFANLLVLFLSYLFLLPKFIIDCF